MPDRPHTKTSKLIGQQAAQWLVSLRDGPMSQADRLAYAQWLKASPAHVCAMLELASLEALLRRSNRNGIPPSRTLQAGGDFYLSFE